MKVKTGNIYRLSSINRLVIVESIIYINSIRLAVVYPLSHAVYMASDDDFIVIDDKCFSNRPIMAESWNKVSVPLEYLTDYVGRLGKKYTEAFESFVYFLHQSCKNNHLKVLTGPPIKSNTDIRYVFRAQESEDLLPIRQKLVKSEPVKEEV